jgi:hypothetical protein
MDDVTKDFIRNELKERITQGVTIKQTKSGDGVGSKDILDIDPVLDKKIQLYKDVQKAIQNDDYSGLNTQLFKFERSGNTLTVSPNVGEHKSKLVELGFGSEPIKIDLTNPSAGNVVARFAGTRTPASAASDYNIGAVAVNKGIPAASDYMATEKVPDRYPKGTLDFMTTPLVNRYNTGKAELDD